MCPAPNRMLSISQFHLPFYPDISHALTRNAAEEMTEGKKNFWNFLLKEELWDLTRMQARGFTFMCCLGFHADRTFGKRSTFHETVPLTT